MPMSKEECFSPASSQEEEANRVPQGVPDISLQLRHPILQTLASRNSWVRVEFFGKAAPTKAEIYRTIELLCMMHNGWS